MNTYLIEFLKALEKEIPPPPKCHHAITYARYGNDESGWEDKLALQINKDGAFHCVFLDSSDLESSPEQLAASLLAVISQPDGGAQTGIGFGQYAR